MSQTKVVAGLLMAALNMASCGGTPDALKDKPDAGRPDAGQPDAGQPDAQSACADTDDGESCGSGRHCIGERCRANVCGDGFVAGAEDCDDGNRAANDGCDANCQLETSDCGNGKIDENETCDDGNQNDGDGCPRTCIVPECGNGVIEPGETCDGPRIVVDAAGIGNRVGCSADCKQTVEEDTCEKCQNEKCVQDVEGVPMDYVDACFRKVNAEYGATEDPKFIQQCIDLVNCALANDCWFANKDLQATACYCGSMSPDQCNVVGPAADAACVPEWQAASRSKNNLDVQSRFSDLAFPSGWGYFLLECYRVHCSAECAPAG